MGEIPLSLLTSAGGDGVEVIYALRNNSDTEAVIVEYGFLDSKGDDVEQLKNNYKDYAEAVVRAITEYKGLPYIAPTESDFYTVQKGDSLWKIASMYDTTVDTLMSINNLKGTTLTINQQLLVPKKKDIDIDINKNDKGIYYTVKSGDTLYKIASSYNVSVDKIKSANKLNSNILQTGQVLLIPIETTDVTETTPSTSNGISYVVVKGDNLYNIANKYKVSVSDIKSLNNLKSNTLQIGQILKIPGTEAYANYTVKKGDSLWKIANKYGVTVNELKQVNNLSGTILQIGDVLLIPTK